MSEARYPVYSSFIRKRNPKPPPFSTLPSIDENVCVKIAVTLSKMPAGITRSESGSAARNLYSGRAYFEFQEIKYK